MALDELTKKIYSPKYRPRIHRTFIWGFCILSCYSLGKIVALSLQSPPGNKSSPPPPSYSFTPPNMARQTQTIINRNLFNTEKGEEKITKVQRKEQGPCLTASNASSSGISLLNTITLQNEKKSLAIIKVKSKPGVLTLRQADHIPTAGKIDRIRPERIIFRNEKTGQCEFVAIKKAKERSRRVSILPREQGKKLLAERKAKQGIANEGNRFNIKRSYLNEGMENLSDLLNQVDAVQIKNPDGTLSFKINGVPPGSIFSKLGIENNDQIKYIDGKPIRSQTQIFGLLNSFQTISNLSITVLRDGQEQKLEYTFAD